MNSLWLQAGLVLALGGYLLWKHWQRQRDEHREAATRMDGHGLEATEIKAHLRELREKPETSRTRHNRTTAAHEEFTRIVRTSLLRLGFFQELHEPKPDQPGRESEHRHC